MPLGPPIDAPDTARFSLFAPKRAQPETQRSIWRSAFNTENDVNAVIKANRQMDFPPDPEFNLAERGMEDNLFQQFPEEFFGAQSAEQYDHIRKELSRGIIDRGNLERSGLSGYGASVVAALASPTLLIPGGSIYKSARIGRSALQSAASAAGYGAAAVGLQEVALQAPANDRTLLESATGVAMGTLLSGALGGALGGGLSYAARSTISEVTGDRRTMGAAYNPFNVFTETDNVSRLTITADDKGRSGEVAIFTHDVDGSKPVEVDISEAAIVDAKGASIWSDEVTDMLYEAADQGKTAVVFKNMATGEDVDTVTSMLRARAVDRFDQEVMIPGEAPSASPEAFDGINPAGVKSGDGDVKLAANFGMGNLFGWISPTMRGYQNRFSPTVRDITMKLDSGGLHFRNPEGDLTTSSDITSRAKARMGQLKLVQMEADEIIKTRQLAGDAIPSKKELNEQITNAIEMGEDFDGDPLIEQLANLYSEKIYKPYSEEAQELGFPGAENWENWQNYVTHVPKKTLLASERMEAEDILTEYFGEKLVDWLGDRIAKLGELKTQAEEFADDVSLSPEDIEKIGEEFQAQIDEFEKGLTADSKQTLENIEATRKQAKDSQDPQERIALRAAANQMEQDDPDLAQFRAGKDNIARRKSNMAKGQAALEKKRAKLMEQIDKTETSAVKALNQLTARASKLLKGKEVKAGDLEKFDADAKAAMELYDKVLEDSPAMQELWDETDIDTKTLVDRIDNMAHRISWEIDDLHRQRAAVRAKITKNGGEYPGSRDKLAKAEADLTEAKKRRSVLKGKITKAGNKAEKEIAVYEPDAHIKGKQKQLAEVEEKIETAQQRLETRIGNVAPAVDAADKLRRLTRERTQLSLDTDAPEVHAAKKAEIKEANDELVKLVGAKGATAYVDAARLGEQIEMLAARGDDPEALDGLRKEKARIERGITESSYRGQKTIGRLKKQRDNLQKSIDASIETDKNVIKLKHETANAEIDLAILEGRIKDLQTRVDNQTPSGKIEDTNLKELQAEEAAYTQRIRNHQALYDEAREVGQPISPSKSVKGKPRTDRGLKTAFGKTPEGIHARLLDLHRAKARLLLTKGERVSKLQERHSIINPEAPIGLAKEKRMGVNSAITKFFEESAARGIEFKNGAPMVRKAASRVSGILMTRLTGEMGRMPLVGALLERGPELLRTLDIDPNRIWTNGRAWREFMERDIDHLSRMYLKTVGADFEIFNTFGSLHPFGRGGDGVKPGFAQKLHDDYQEAFATAREKYADNPKKLKREETRIHKSRARAERDILALVDRVRHLRGIPDDPQAIPHRLGRAALNLNTVRLMGNVVPSSLADPARMIIRHRVGNLYRHGFANLARNLPAIKATRRELQYAAVGNDLQTHARLAAMTDIFDDHMPGNRVERGLQYSTNIMGVVAAFDAWNAFWKQSSGIVGTLQIVENLEKVASKGGQIGQGERFLTQAGIDNEMAAKIWTQLNSPGGANRIKGVLVPNTENWTDLAAQRAFRGALIRITDDTIVTPGLERPLVMDGSLSGRLIFQFRSFAFASLTKTLVYGAQELRMGNADVALGAALSMGLGMISWWTWSNLAGDKHRATMEDADVGRWIDEGLARSGLLGPLGEVLTFAQKIPGLENMLTFGDTGVTKAHNPYRQPFVDLFGPSVGLAKDLGTIASTMHDPKESTIKAARRLIPYNQVFYMRWPVNKAEEKVTEGLGIR